MSEGADLKSGVEEIVGESPAFSQAVTTAKRLALSDAAMLIGGASGIINFFLRMGSGIH